MKKKPQRRVFIKSDHIDLVKLDRQTRRMHVVFESGVVEDIDIPLAHLDVYDDFIIELTLADQERVTQMLEKYFARREKETQQNNGTKLKAA